MTAKEFIRKNKDKSPAEIFALAQKAGIAKKMVIKTASKMRSAGENIPFFKDQAARPAPIKPKHTKGNTISVSDFIRKNDIYITVSEAVKQIQEGYLYERSDFVKTFMPHLS